MSLLPNRYVVALWSVSVCSAVLWSVVSLAGVFAAELLDRLADQPPESLAGKIEWVALPETQAEAVAHAVLRFDSPLKRSGKRPVLSTGAGSWPTVLIEARARATDKRRPAGDLTLAGLAFRVAAAQDAGYVRLEHREATWYESTFWQGGEQWLRVGKDWHHPGDRAPSVRRFLAPHDGSVTVTGSVRKAHLAGDGVRAAIVHNDRPVWQHELAGDDGQGLDPNLVLTVQRGDTLRFVVDKLGSISCDTTYWDPVITYVDGLRFQASEAFAAKKQGAGGWYYETPADGYDAHGVPRLSWFDAGWALCEIPLTVGKPVELQSGSAQPCAVLADGQDASGIAIAFDAGMPWRLSVELQSDGMLTVALSTRPEDRETVGQALDDGVLLGRVALGPYLGTSSIGMQRLACWLDQEETESLGAAPVFAQSLRSSLRQAGISELDYWAMVQQDWQRQDQTDRQRPETYQAAVANHLEKTRHLVAYLQSVHGPDLLSTHADRLQQLAVRADSDADPGELYPGQSAVGLRRSCCSASACPPRTATWSCSITAGGRGRAAGCSSSKRPAGRSAPATSWTEKLETGNVLEPRLVVRRAADRLLLRRLSRRPPAARRRWATTRTRRRTSTISGK
jgi:hypothetical protein